MADTLRILYVDDEPSLLSISKLFLEKGGEFAVDTLTSAIVALEQLTTEQYDAIISDYQMPGMDGITFLKQLKASGNTTPFIIFTGRGREEVVIEALNEGADFYIQKGGEPKAQFTELAYKIRSAVSRKRTEKLAKDTERRLYDIINFLPDATFAIDTEGSVIAWNRAIEEMTGVPAREMLSKGTFEYAIPFYGERRPILIDLVSIPDEELSRGRYAVIKKEGGVLIAETTLPRPLGKYSVLLGKASLLYNEEGDVIGAIESIRDITKQKQAEEELRKARDDYFGLLEHMTDVYYRSDTEGRLILASKSWAKDLGYDDLSECIGKNIADTFYADPGERKRFLEEIYRNGSVSDYEVSLKKKDGTPLPVATSSYLCFDDFGTVLGVEGTWRDITERKRTEVALAESEEKYRTLVEKANEAILIAQDDVFVFANKRMSELLGVPAGELEGRPFIDFIWPGDRELVFANYRKRLSGEAISDAYDFRIIGAGGRLTWVFLSAAAVQWKGRPATLNLVTDITERKRAEMALRESEEKYRQILTTAHEGVWILDQDWCVTFVNQHLEEMLGYQSGEILGRPLNFFIFEPDRADHSQQRMTRKKGIPAKYERKFKKKDGSELWTLVSATPLFDNSGVFTGTFGMLTDITDRKRVERALSESEEQSRMLLSQLPDIVMVHQDGIIVYANQTATDKTGYTREELLGSHLFGYVVPDAREMIVRNMARRAAGEKVDDYEVDMIHKSGALHHIIVRTSPIVFNQVPSVVMILIDITGRKQAENALQEANKKLKLLSDITRHDINNQLSVLQGFLAILEDSQLDPSQKEYFQKVTTAARRIAAMVRFAKGYEEIGIHAPIWQDSRTLVDTAAKQAPLGKVVVINDLPASAEMFADPLVVKVFYNLMDNAVRYGGKITTLRFFVQESGDDHLIVCEDDGDGVPADEKEKIFERGFGKNTGLGLALSREILSITSITIRETGEPGGGARIEMMVPKGMWRMAGKGVL